MSNRYYDLKRDYDTNQKVVIGKYLDLPRALTQAVKDKHIGIVSLLLDANVNPNLYDTDGDTPLHVSVLSTIAHTSSE